MIFDHTYGLKNQYGNVRANKYLPLLYHKQYKAAESTRRFIYDKNYNRCTAATKASVVKPKCSHTSRCPSDGATRGSLMPKCSKGILYP